MNETLQNFNEFIIAFFYVLYSATANKFYIGHTTEPMEERLWKHNSNHKGFTGQFRDWIIVYYENFESKDLAFQHELEVKIMEK